MLGEDHELLIWDTWTREPNDIFHVFLNEMEKIVD